MSLSSYARAAYNIGEELRDLLRDKAFEPFLEALSLHSPDRLFELRRAEKDLVRDLATLAPKPRQKRLSKLSVEQQFWAIAAAAQTAFEAAAVLDAAEVHLRPGGAYRSMIGEVQQVLEAQYDSPEATWPFPTWSPFQ